MLNTLEFHNGGVESSLSDVLEMGGAERAGKILAIAEGRRGYLEKSKQEGKETSRKTSSGARVGNFELYDFLKESISPTLTADRTRDSMVYQEAGWMKNEGVISSVTSKWAKGTGGPSGSEHFNLVLEADVVHKE